MNERRHGLVPLARPPSHAAGTWGPYYDTLHPPRTVHMMTAWKVVPKWMKSAEMLWEHRQQRRRAYEAIHGSDPATWPSRHPGVVLNEALSACLGCRWLYAGTYYNQDHVFQYAVDIARRHEESDGQFRGGEDQLKPTARWTPSPDPVETPHIPRRIPILPLRIADRYASGKRRS